MYSAFSWVLAMSKSMRSSRCGETAVGAFAAISSRREDAAFAIGSSSD